MKRAVIISSLRANASRKTFHTFAPLASPDTAKPQSTRETQSAKDDSTKEASAAKMTPHKKTLAELDQELREKLESMSGEGGGAGVEYENGRAEGLKRGVKSNMFRVI